MDKIKVTALSPSILPLLPVKNLRQDAGSLQPVDATDWWTLYYIENGTVEITCEPRSYLLQPFQALLLPPGQPHRRLTFGEPVSAVQLDFQAYGPELLPLQGKRLLLDKRCRRLLRDLVEESHTDQQEEPLYGTERYVQLLCEQLVIQLKRVYAAQLKESGEQREGTPIPSPWEQSSRRNRHYTIAGEMPNGLRRSAQASSAESANLQLYNKLVKYLEERVYESISLDELVAEFHFSKTHLSQTFKAHSGQTILTYYNTLKIEEAKRLITETDMNFSQISNQLSFSSLHYFSRLFKKHTAMSPSEYQESTNSLEKGAV